MKKNKWALIYDDVVTKPIRTIIEDDNNYIIVVAVAGIEQAAIISQELVKEQVTRIELCGMFGATGQALVAEAIKQAIPVRVILYGIDSITQVAAYKDGFERGDVLNGALIALVPNFSGKQKILYRSNGPEGKLAIAIASNSEEIREVALTLVEKQYTLLELYGDYSYSEIVQLIKEVNGRAAIGVIA